MLSYAHVRMALTASARLCPSGVSVYWAQADHDREDLATLVDLVATDRLHPEIGTTAAWQATPDVLAAVRDRGVRGNAVLTLPRAA